MDPPSGGHHHPEPDGSELGCLEVGSQGRGWWVGVGSTTAAHGGMDPHPSAQLHPSTLSGCPSLPRGPAQQPIFRSGRLVSLLLRAPQGLVYRTLFYVAIIISIDGFSVPPSIRLPNYTVERSHALPTIRLMNLPYLDPIISSLS